MSRNWWSGHKVIDPAEMEARFANEDGMAFLDAVVNEELSKEGQEMLDRVKGVLDSLPAREADFIDLYYFKRLKQTDIATIFKVSQPTVCYRLQRAAHRIRFLLSLPEIEEQALVDAVQENLEDPLDSNIMVLMYHTTCQSEVAKRLGVSQGLVRHRFIRSIGRLSKIEGLEDYVELFQAISTNLNILREVQRPTWGAQVTHILG